MEGIKVFKQNKIKKGFFFAPITEHGKAKPKQIQINFNT